MQALPSVFFSFLFLLLRLTSFSSGGILAIFCINTFSSSSAINTMSSPGCKIWAVPFRSCSNGSYLLKQPGQRVLPQSCRLKIATSTREIQKLLPSLSLQLPLKQITSPLKYFCSRYPIENPSFTSAYFYSKGQRGQICNSLIYPCSEGAVEAQRYQDTANKYPSIGRCSHFIRLNLLKEQSTAQGCQPRTCTAVTVLAVHQLCS